ncbi:MAG: translation elongation factor Ts [Rhodobacteraceae bacterium]|nr:translation elongation factor Ts [Paracoccaceae bacterium]
MAITAAMVKELRESTGAGMMDAKKALTETEGDFEAAVDWLRTKGLAKAAKKSGRVAAEGLVAIRRLVKINGESVASYVHNAATAGMGQIGVIVAMNGSNEEFGRQVAMHIAAANPAALDEGSLDPELVEREKAVLTEQARESGKPEAVIEKMIVGRMKKFLGEVTLLGQDFVVNPDVTVAQAAKEAGVEITGYARVAVGEGIEKKEEDFAAEVAKAAQG